MLKTPELFPIRQSDEGKWEVKDTFGNCHKCETREDAEILSNVLANAVLFKYRSMATSEAKEHTLDILKNQRLYCSAPDSFNDPFECQANISFVAPLDVKNEQAKKHLRRENPNMTEVELERRAPAKWQQVEEGGTGRLRSLFLNDAGVVSFSTINDNILMWAHYAGGHDGICIEFRCCLDKKHVDFEKHVSFFSQAQRVQYKEILPEVNFYTDGPVKKLEAAILTKSKHWSYEQEWRIIVPDAVCKSRYITVPSGVITAICLGCKITEENRNAILQSIGTISVRVFQAKRQPDTYGLCFEPISNG